MARHHIRTSGQCTGKYDGVSYAKQRWRQPCRDAKSCVSRAKKSAMTGIYSHRFIAHTCSWDARFCVSTLDYQCIMAGHLYVCGGACFNKNAVWKDASRATLHAPTRRKSWYALLRNRMNGPVCKEQFTPGFVSEVCGIRPYGQKKRTPLSP